MLCGLRTASSVASERWDKCEMLQRALAKAVTGSLSLETRACSSSRALAGACKLQRARHRTGAFLFPVIPATCGKCTESAAPKCRQQIKSPFVSRTCSEKVGCGEKVGRHPAANMSGCLERYGKILNVDTTGASEATAKPEGLSYAGVPASEKIAERDLKNMEKYQAKITKVGNSKCVDPAVIAGIISRESHAGTVLKDGWGDHGNAFGLMQVDKRYHNIVGSWDSEEHLAQGTDILCGMINEIQKKFPTWTKEQQLKGGISAYNAGANNVQSYDRMDIGTTHNDYANDVVARAKFYKRNGY
ncbi:lysozyme g-like [Gymnogyps californianus]|uniref:lysozyme g-like n=1 Tax=Gymnogyps californianus TaxID=33616 RepID=UPI0021C6F670|nr:lysozyme g-like [Gymnogyps californianus]